MDKSTKGLIEYLGLAETLPQNPYSFKHLSIHERLSLSNDKPDIKQLVRATATTDVVQTRVIQTPKSVSFDGSVLTGWGLIVENHLDLKIEYIPKLSNNPVEIVYFHIPFNAFLVLPEHFKTTYSIRSIGYIEDICTKKIDKKEIFLNTFVLLDAVIYR